MANKVLLKAEGDKVLVFPLSFLGSAWGEYKRAVDSVEGRYVTVPCKGTLMDVDQALLLVPRLKAAGFEPALGESLRARFQERAAAGCLASRATVAAVPAMVPNPRRGARCVLEGWAANTLLEVAALDPDRARVLNHQGFSAHDGELGHSLARQIQRVSGLTERQWAAVVKLARRYRRQASTPEPVWMPAAMPAPVDEGSDEPPMTDWTEPSSEAVA
jgi:hypothetical protein